MCGPRGGATSYDDPIALWSRNCQTKKIKQGLLQVNRHGCPKLEENSPVDIVDVFVLSPLDEDLSVADNSSVWLGVMWVSIGNEQPL